MEKRARCSIGSTQTVTDHGFRQELARRLSFCVVAALLVAGCCSSPPSSTSKPSDDASSNHMAAQSDLEAEPATTGWLALPKEERKMIRETIREHPLITYAVEDERGLPRSHLRVPLKIEALFEKSPKAVIEQLIAAASYADPMESLKAIAWAMGLMTGTETAAHMEPKGHPQELKKYVTPNERGFIERDYDIASLERQLAEME